MLRKKILPGNAIYYRDTRRNEQPPKDKLLESQLAKNINSSLCFFYVCVDKRFTISGSVLFIDTQHNLAADRIQRPSVENKIKRCFLFNPNNRFSGITAEDLDGVTTTIRDVQVSVS